MSPTAPALAAEAPGPTGTWTGTPGAGGQFNYGPSLGTYAGGTGGAPLTWAQNTWGQSAYSPGNNWYDPATGRHEGWGSVGAGTENTPYGWGVPGFGQDPIQLLPEYMKYLQSAPGYIPGSGTYNQFRLDQPGLLTNILGQQVNARYGQGGTGDPTTGLEPRTPEEWLSGPKAFDWQYNMGQTPETKGLDYIANLFGRPDAGTSGISTAAWSAPQQYWAGLADAVQRGVVKASAFGLKALASKGFNVSPPGGPANLGGGAGGAGGQGGQGGIEGAYASIIAMQQAQVAAQIAYQEWQMRTGDEGIAMEKAQQAWSQKFQEVGQAFAQRATTAGITGQWDGQDTMAMQQQKYAQDLANRTFAEQQLQNQNATGLGLLQAQSALQGPRDWAKYWQMSASAPQGLTSALSSLAGRYNFAPGAQGTPGPATLQSRTQDLLSGGQQGAGGTTGTGDGQAGNAWGWNLQNYARMSPSMQQGVLGAAEAGGAYGPDIEALLKQAAPRYTGPATAGIGL